MVGFGHIEQVIEAIIGAVAVAMMTDISQGCFGGQPVHVNPAGFAIGSNRSSSIP